jgi:hypothetical protein
VLKAPDVAEVAAAVARADAAGIPVVTLVTDLPNSARIAYAGADNRAAGETAAYLIGEFLGTKSGKVLVTLSSGRFRGEEEREIGFRRVIRARYPRDRHHRNQRGARHRCCDGNSCGGSPCRRSHDQRRLFDRRRQPGGAGGLRCGRPSRPRFRRP